MVIRSVIFDLDGVLVDACEWHYTALNKSLYDVAGFELGRDEHLETFNGLPTYKKLEILVEQNRLTTSAARQVAELKQKLTMDIIRETAREDPVKVEMHRKLRDLEIAVGCVTNCKRESAEAMLEATGQQNIIPFLICNEDVEHPKPHPEGYITSMVFLRSFPKETLIIEDSPKGLAAAYATGARVVQVDNCEQVNWSLVERNLI